MKAGVLVSRAIEDALAATGLTARQFLLLSIVAEATSQSQLEVSRRLHLDPTIVVGLVDELEQRGLVGRSKHPDDRRRHVLALTAKGSTALAGATERTRAVEDAFLGALSAADRARLRSMLARVMEPKLDLL
jgi:DNA-binding MarR family transcriptional regulator